MNIKARAEETRKMGCFDAEIPDDGFPLDLFLEFVSDMFPGIDHGDLYILQTDEGKICVKSERPVIPN